MKRILRKIKVDKNYAKMIQRHIDQNRPLEEGVGRVDYPDNTFTAKFTKSIEVDIKIYDSKQGPWIDCVLFDKGNEAGLLEPQYCLLGVYPFEYKGVRYVVELY